MYRNRKLDPTQVQDRRGGSLGGIAGVGGGAGLIVLVLSLVLGVDLTGVVPSSPATQQTGGTLENCQTGEDANNSEDCRIVGFVNSIQQFWSDELPRQNIRYAQAQTVLFSQATQTACGNATSAVGPFYCPPDQHIYIDLTFFGELESRFGAEGGPFAQGYVIAHEYGHHIQNLTGVIERSQDDRQGAESGAVRVELQADCYAGLWAGRAVETGYLNPLTNDDVAQAIDAAAAVGDDRIQKQSTGRVNPETWTHGSSQQRQKWFLTGYRNGTFQSCDTFSGGI